MPDQLEAWPGRPYPLGATYDGAGTNFSLFSEVAERVELCLFDDDGVESDRPRRGGRRPLLARLPARRSARASATAIASTARGRLSAGAAVQPVEAAARSVRQGRSTAKSTGTRRASATTSATRSARNDDDSAPHVPKSVVHNPYFDWGNDRPPATPLHESIIYEVHVKGFTARAPGHPRGAPRAPTPGWPTRPPSTTSATSASPPSSSCPCTSSCTTPTSSSAACATTGATTRSDSSRRTTATPRAGTGSRCRSSRRWCARCTRRASR